MLRNITKLGKSDSSTGTRKPRAAGASGRTASSATGSWLRRSLPSIATFGVSLLILTSIGLLPAKTWLEQREITAQTQGELERVEAEVLKLQNQLDLLETDDQIERTARENFDLVYPGEESYRILPAPKDEKLP